MEYSRSFSEKFIDNLVQYHKASPPTIENAQALDKAAAELTEYALEFARYLTDVLAIATEHSEEIPQDALSMSMIAVGELINLGQIASVHQSHAERLREQGGQHEHT